MKKERMRREEEEGGMGKEGIWKGERGGKEEVRKGRVEAGGYGREEWG